MPEPADYAGLIEGQSALLDRINAGETGLEVLDDVVRLAQRALGARGASFVEDGRRQARIVAASGACAWALGRPYRGLRLSGTERVQRVPLDSLDPEFAARLRGCDLVHVLGARCAAGDLVVGSLHAYFTTADGAPDASHMAALALLAATIAHLYRDRSVRHDDRELAVAAASHELRTPVTVIKGYADILTNHWESLDEPGRRDAAQIIGRRAGELVRLVDRLLSATSDTDPISGTAPGPLDLAEALRAAVAALPPHLRRRVVLHDLPADLPKAYGDRDCLATVVTELVTNADKHSPPDTPVELTASADERMVLLRVSDRGIGIRPEHVELAFERYWQGDRADHLPDSGVGLGLYLVRRMVERQHGWVSLRPRDGGGTVAEVRLPPDS